MSKPPKQVKIPPPPYGRLRAFAFDPILSQRVDTYEINVVTLKLPWKKFATRAG